MTTKTELVAEFERRIANLCEAFDVEQAERLRLVGEVERLRADLATAVEYTHTHQARIGALHAQVTDLKRENITLRSNGSLVEQRDAILRLTQERIDAARQRDDARETISLNEREIARLVAVCDATSADASRERAARRVVDAGLAQALSERDDLKAALDVCNADAAARVDRLTRDLERASTKHARLKRKLTRLRTVTIRQIEDEG